MSLYSTYLFHTIFFEILIGIVFRISMRDSELEHMNEFGLWLHLVYLFFYTFKILYNNFFF